MGINADRLHYFRVYIYIWPDFDHAFYFVMWLYREKKMNKDRGHQGPEIIVYNDPAKRKKVIYLWL